ncbi:phospholipase D family protein [Pseudomonas sp. MWU13-2105]|uniref:phospholipase D family protein n=1 Tax=Pseudomonas sp. MWU13-2105 TaxID=2935074 RepID=UPI00200BD8AC|nr:phospholipase D family protein [Pseudomonas sp. MWU13-2105]
MKLLLLPKRSGTELQDVYRRALRESTHLYIVSAYLTHWDIKGDLGHQCESFKFIVGKDFGITRKAACEDVLRWLPSDRHDDFLAAEAIDGFHPKAVFWRELDGKSYALVGSSNLSKAAFSTNYEANGYSLISDETFKAAEQWIEKLANMCVTLDENWIRRYREAIQPKKPKSPDTSETEGEDDGAVFELILPDPHTLKRYAAVLARRRQQMRLFKSVRPDLETLFRTTARARAWNPSRNLDFYGNLNELWSLHTGSRFQGLGWERHGRGSNFQELARSLVRILDAQVVSRDRVVKVEIDRLHHIGVNTRGALLSEMLCQFFPKQYHVLNKPVRDWLRDSSLDRVRGATEGENYIRCARLFRIALERAKDYPAKNIAQLDALIWLESNPDSEF